MKRRIIIALNILFCGVAMAQTFSGGTGTSTDPYLISCKNDLEELCRLVDTPGEDNVQQTYGKHFKLTNDITEPLTCMIGVEGFFRGDFDGDGHSITVDINMPNDDYVGLFGTVKTGAVHDLAVKGSVIGRRYVGGIVANPTNEAQLYNLVNYASVSSTYTSIAYVGGVIGGIISQNNDDSLTGATINNCANYGTVSCNGSAVGGVIGYSGQSVGNTICDIANYGYIDNTGAQRVGGAIGNPMWNDKIHRVANFGILSNENLSGCLGNANPADLGEILYDKQYAHNVYAIPAQEKNSTEMTGTQMKELLGEGWMYADNLLPRPNMGGLENSDLAILYATPLLLADGDYLANVTQDFKVSLGNVNLGRVSWTAKNGCVEILADGTAMLKAGGEEILTATFNGESRDIHIIINSTNGVNALTNHNLKKDNVWRNLNGQVVMHPLHGIYIVNGKKVAK